MTKIIIDGKEIESRPRISVLQAALDGGWNIPHYCYHPGLKVVASCRLCLMEMKMPHPETKEMGWAPKLFPACQTPVKDGMEVRFESDTVRDSQRHVMEYYLLNHPLDCPVCDKAGECSLQDYSEQFGSASSRMVEDKHKNPKKDIGSHTLLYQDRCVLCTRCVRFCDEIAGSGELRVVNRGSRGEIDVFPGIPLENELQGNVVDLCPVGALLDKQFLFKQRVWLLQTAKSVSPADSRGSTIWIDYNNQGIHRIRPRYNPKVNEWWISDEARFEWKYINSDQRLNQPRVRRGSTWESVTWEDLAGIVRYRFEQVAAPDRGAAVAAVLSPMMSCEEAWLLAKFIREVAPESTLVPGYVPIEGEDRVFPKGFVIKAEKCPNRRGVEEIIAHLGGNTMSFDEFVTAAGEEKFKAAYVVGGYPSEWITKDHHKALSKIGLLATHDLFPSLLEAAATLQVPGASFAEREGSFMNCGGLVQPFERAIAPLEGVKPDGQFLYDLAGESGLFRAEKVRQTAADWPVFGDVYVPPDEPKHAH
jgi:NADH-quinone oxidoreductase subunit G